MNTQEPKSVGAEIGAAIGKEIGAGIGQEIERAVTGNKANKEKKGKSPFARRVGYAFGLLFSLLFLWIVTNVDTWSLNWITEEWSQIESILRLSVTIDLIVYAVFLIGDARLIYYLGKLLTNIFGIYVSIRMFQVFPFDFNELAGGWGWLNSVFPVLIILGIIALIVSLIIRTVRLAAGKEIYD